LIAGKDDEMFMTRSLDIMPKTTEQHIQLHAVINLYWLWFTGDPC